MSRKICRDYPNCKNSVCRFQHPFVCENMEKVEDSNKPDLKEPDILCGLYFRANLGKAADYVRAPAMNIVKGLTEPFKSVLLAKQWIIQNGNHSYLYQIRGWFSNTILLNLVWDDVHNWHVTSFKQNSNRGYKSDKDIALRIY